MCSQLNLKRGSTGAKPSHARLAGISRPPRQLGKSYSIAIAAQSTPHRPQPHLHIAMAFPGNPGMMPASMNPNAGMSEQEQQMVKAVCHSEKSHYVPDGRVGIYEASS